MAKAKKPLFSLEAKGKLGPLVISRSLSGSHKVAVKRPPANPRSPAQLEQRANYTTALEVWHTLTPAQKHEYYLMDPQIGAAPAYLNFMKVFLMSVPDQLDTLIAKLNSLITLMAAGLPATLISDSLKTREQNPLTGLATSGKQDTMITALQLIDDLRAALGSVNTDDLQVDVKTMPTVTVQAAGGDKPLSLESIIGAAEVRTATATAEWFSTGAVPAGKVWVITSFAVLDENNIPTRLLYSIIHDGVGIYIGDEFRTLAVSRVFGISGQWYLDAGDYLGAFLTGIVVGDSIVFYYTGYQMDAP